jgi:hypothetical protein
VTLESPEVVSWSSDVFSLKYQVKRFSLTSVIQVFSEKLLKNTASYKVELHSYVHGLSGIGPNSPFATPTSMMGASCVGVADSSLR